MTDAELIELGFDTNGLSNKIVNLQKQRNEIMQILRKKGIDTRFIDNIGVIETIRQNSNLSPYDELTSETKEKISSHITLNGSDFSYGQTTFSIDSSNGSGDIIAKSKNDNMKSQVRDVFDKIGFLKTHKEEGYFGGKPYTRQSYRIEPTEKLPGLIYEDTLGELMNEGRKTYFDNGSIIFYPKFLKYYSKGTIQYPALNYSFERDFIRDNIGIVLGNTEGSLEINKRDIESSFPGHSEISNYFNELEKGLGKLRTRYKSTVSKNDSSNQVRKIQDSHSDGPEGH